MIATQLPPAAPAGIRFTTAADYFGDYSAVSQSMLKTFMDRRRLYQAYYVDQTAEPPDPTPPMQKGTATHTALLEPERFTDLVICYPPSLLAKNGAVSTSEAKAFRDQHEAAGRVVLKEAEYANVKAMAESVRRVCGKWLDLPGRKEQSVYWTDSETGLRCKARPDWIIEVDGTAFIFDIKTTNDIRPNVFARRCADNGYWLQHDHYGEGVEAATGMQCEFRFVVVESEFPHGSAIFTLHERSVYVAGLARRNAMRQLAECLETGDWSEPWERQIIPLVMPAWAFDESLR